MKKVEPHYKSLPWEKQGGVHLFGELMFYSACPRPPLWFFWGGCSLNWQVFFFRTKSSVQTAPLIPPQPDFIKRKGWRSWYLVNFRAGKWGCNLQIMSKTVKWKIPPQEKIPCNRRWLHFPTVHPAQSQCIIHIVSWSLNAAALLLGPVYKLLYFLNERRTKRWGHLWFWVIHRVCGKHRLIKVPLLEQWQSMAAP